MPATPATRKMPAEGIKVLKGIDVTIKQREEMNFDGLPPSLKTVWFGATTFEIDGVTWTLDSFVGDGAEGQAYLATQTSSGRTYVAKFCSRKDSKESGIVREIQQGYRGSRGRTVCSSKC